MFRVKNTKKRNYCFILLLVLLLLCACNGTEKNTAVLWYQEGPAEINGEIQIEGAVYTVSLSLGRVNDAGERDITLSFTAPEEMEGMTFRMRGKDIFAVYDTVEIPLTKEAAGNLFTPAALFALDEKNITGRQKGEDGKTLSKVCDGQNAWDISTDAEGIPTNISATLNGKNITFSILSYVQTDV